MQIDPPQPPLMRKARKARLMAELQLLSRASRRPVVGTAPVVVSLTSYAHRLETVHLAIESIARSQPRPQRFILWVAHVDLPRTQTAGLQKLVRRGLEVLPTQDYGPHKKNYPYARDHADAGVAMVTADDDILYPRGWLAGLVVAHRERPEALIGYRAHEMALEAGRLAPYSRWQPATAATPGELIFVTGGAGAVFPPSLMQAMGQAGEDFMRTCPRADDVWINLQALRSSTPARIVPAPANALSLPGVQQRGALHSTNVHGGNDEQIAATYTDDDLELLRGAAAD